MEYYVYIVQCADESLYTGITNDLERRMGQHNGAVPGGAKYTLGRSPVSLVYTEACDSKSEALKRESSIKKLSRTKKMELIHGLQKRA